MTNPRGDRRLDFREGRVCYVSSTIPQERLAIMAGEERVLSRTTTSGVCWRCRWCERTLFTDLLIDEGGVGPGGPP